MTFTIHADAYLIEESFGWYEGRRCVKCGKPYPCTQYSKNPKVSCDECREDAKRAASVPTVCETCGKVFYRVPSQPRKYCSLSCASGARAGKGRSVICKKCGREFEAFTHNAIYCEECRRRRM